MICARFPWRRSDRTSTCKLDFLFYRSSSWYDDANNNQIPTPSPTYKTPHAVQEPQPIKRLPISPPSIVILRVLTSSSQLPLKLPGRNQMAVELVQKIGRRITLVTEDSRETVFLFQRLSIALQRGNAVSFFSTFTATGQSPTAVISCLIFSCLQALCWWAKKIIIIIIRFV